jgi:hypothetical protein
MRWLKKLYQKTKTIAAMYTRIFIVVMFLNQLLFFGFCLNPICLVAAMPHVLFITVVIGAWVHKPTYRKTRKALKFVRESYDEVKTHVEQNRENHGKQRTTNKIFTGDIYLFVTQYQSKGEEDFQAILRRHEKPKIVSKIRMDNRDKSKALLKAIRRSKHNFKSGDIVAIAGFETIDVGDSLCDPANPMPLDPLHIEEPTLSVTFAVNNSPLAGTEGKFVTSNKIQERLDFEKGDYPIPKNWKNTFKENFLFPSNFLSLGYIIK